MLADLLCLFDVALKKYIGYASLSLLEYNVLQLLYVPTGSREDLEAVRKHADFIQVPDLNLVQRSIIDRGSVHPVELVDLTFLVEFLDNSDCFLTYGGLGLLSAGSAVVGSVDAGVSSNWMVEVVSLFDSWLAQVDVGADPEVGAGLELSKEGLFVDDIATCRVDQHRIWLHLAEEFSIDHVLRLRCRRSVQTNDVSASQELVLAHVREAQLFIKAFLLRARADNHLHFKSSCGLAHKLANIAEANKADGAAFDASAVREHALIPISSFQHVNAFSHTPVNGED